MVGTLSMLCGDLIGKEMLKRVTISKVPVVQKDSNFIMFFTQSIFKLLLVQILHGVYINRKKKTLKQIINGLKTRIINCKYLFGYEGRFCFTYPDYFHSGFLLFFFFLWMILIVSSLVSTESKLTDFYSFNKQNFIITINVIFIF